MTDKFGKARIEKIGRLWVIYLKGTPFERGFQHGTLMRYIAKNSIDFYKSLPVIITCRLSGRGIASTRPFQRIKHYLIRKLISRLSQDVLEEIRGLSVGLGMKLEEVAEAAMLGEVLQCAEKILGMVPFAPRFWIPGISGTAVIRESTGGSLFVGRNFDFWGAGYWDENPAVIFHYPDKGKAFCAISTAGFPCGGYTAINEDGLLITATMLSAPIFNTRGKPVLSAIHDLLRNCSTVNEALALLDTQKIAGMWGFALAGGRDLDAAVLEISTKSKNLRKPDDHSIVMTEKSGDEIYLENNALESASHILSNRARHERALFLLKHLKITPGRIADILSDHFDPLSNNYRSAGFTISKNSTLSSSVFSLHSGKFYVSESKAPSSRGGFVGFEIGGEPVEEMHATGRLEISDTPEYRITTSRDYYIKASSEYLSSQDLNRVLALLDQCIAIDPVEPTYQFLDGIFKAMVGNYKGAISSFDSALEYEKVEIKKDLISLWKARAYDLLDRREISVKIYGELLEKNAFRSISRAATRLKKNPFAEKDLSRVFVDFANGDTIEPQ